MCHEDGCGPLGFEQATGAKNVTHHARLSLHIKTAEAIVKKSDLPLGIDSPRNSLAR
jgi:hypothetical protein